MITSGDTKQNFFVCLRALTKMVQHVWYSDLTKTEKLKTREGIFQWFLSCLLDQGVNVSHLLQTLNKLRAKGLLDYENLIIYNERKLKRDLREALKSYRMPNRATKAIVVNIEKIEKEYKGNLHNILSFSKNSLEVWERVNDFYWFGVKKSGIFIRELVNRGVWSLTVEEIPIPPDSRVRRVLFRLGLIKDRNDLKEVEQAARGLSKEVKITSLDLDCVLWVVGDDKICGQRKASCEKCPLEDYCPKVTRDVLL